MLDDGRGDHRTVLHGPEVGEAVEQLEASVAEGLGDQLPLLGQPGARDGRVGGADEQAEQVRVALAVNCRDREAIGHVVTTR